MNTRQTAAFLISFSFGYASSTLIYAALSTFLAWWIAALVTLVAAAAIGCTETYGRAVETAAAHAVVGVRKASTWLRARFA